MSSRWRAPFLVALTLVTASCDEGGPTDDTPPPPPPPGPPPPPSAERHLAWASIRDGNWEIYAGDLFGEDGKNITNNAAEDITPAFRKGSGKVAFASDRPGNHEIYVYDTDQLTLVRLTNDSRPDYSPTWSGDGSKIAFVREVTPGHSQIFVMKADGTGAVNISNSPNNDIQPHFRPTQNQLVFASDRHAKYGPNSFMEVYRMNSDGTGIMRLTFNDEGVDYYPTWSPDGVLIAFATDRVDVQHCYNQALEVFVMESDGSNQRNVTNHCRGDAGPTWANNAELILMSDRDTQTKYAWDLYRVALDGTVMRRLTTTGKDAGPSWRY